MGLHGNWLHIIMNITMLMAFGTGVEQWYGAKKYIVFFILCGLFAIIPEFIIQPELQSPLIGASGSLSGLFAAILLILQRQGRLPTGKYGIWPFAMVWVGISVLFGLFGTQMAGAPIAWLAHLGGFFAGYALTRLTYFKI
jgi:membrane associated rhomboid family serine protease